MRFFSIIKYQALPHIPSIHGIRETDHIILGDFNDNPFAVDDQGERRFSDQYMSEKGYSNLVSTGTGATRMDNNLSSIVDHLLVNRSARGHLYS